MHIEIYEVFPCIVYSSLVLWTLLIAQVVTSSNMCASCQGFISLFCNPPSTGDHEMIPAEQNPVWSAAKTKYCLDWLGPNMSLWTPHRLLGVVEDWEDFEGKQCVWYYCTVPTVQDYIEYIVSSGCVWSMCEDRYMCELKSQQSIDIETWDGPHKSSLSLSSCVQDCLMQMQRERC